MAITSIGYDGSVDELAWAKLAPALHADYLVGGADDWKVTAKPAADRTTRVAVGWGGGHGVRDDSDSVVELAHDVVASGTRWDMVVARRLWTGAGGSTTFEIIKSGADSTLLPNRNRTPGTLDDQPLALVGLAAGQSQPTQIIDLRAWAANGGLTCQDGRVLQYMDRVGTVISIGAQVTYRRVLTAAGQPAWDYSNLYQQKLWGIGRAQGPVNTIIPSDAQTMFQAGSIRATTDAAGWTRLTFPRPFPNGLISLQLTNGDDTIGNALVFALDGGGNKDWAVYRTWGPSGGGTNFVPLANFPHRVNYLAAGW